MLKSTQTLVVATNFYLRTHKKMAAGIYTYIRIIFVITDTRDTLLEIILQPLHRLFFNCLTFLNVMKPIM